MYLILFAITRVVAQMVKCDVCGAEMQCIETKQISDATYDMYKCEKCNKLVAKRVIQSLE